MLPLLASSCTQFARFEARPLDVEVSATRLTDRRLGGQTWTLQSLTEEALKHHPEIAVARAKYDIAVAAVRSAGERPNPTATLSPQIVTPWTKWIAGTYGIDFDWTFETAGKRSARQLAAHAQVRAAAAKVIDTIWKVRSAVRKAFLEVYAAGQRTQLLNEAIAQQGELLAALDERVKAGSESRTATTQARLLQAQMRLQAAESAKLAAIARAALAESLGMGLQGIRDADFSFAAFESSRYSAPGKQKALTRRADVLTALVTALGLLPLAIGSGEAGREIEGPMAIVILGGLVSSTLLNLLVLPSLAWKFGRFSSPAPRSFPPAASAAGPSDSP